MPIERPYDLDADVARLKTEKLYFRDLEEIDKIAFPAIYFSINDSIINGSILTKREVAKVVETIAMFESSSSTRKGTMPFKSSLFIKSNNAFGIKGKGHVTKTAEYVNGERMVIVSSFKKYDSFDESINDLLSLLVRRYHLKEAKTSKEVFHTMKRKGYFTAPITYMYSLIRTNKRLNKYKNFKDDNI